jgi:ribosomal protein L20
MHALSVAQIPLNRKTLAEMAINDPVAFAGLVQTAQAVK